MNFSIDEFRFGSCAHWAYVYELQGNQKTCVTKNLSSVWLARRRAQKHLCHRTHTQLPMTLVCECVVCRWRCCSAPKWILSENSTRKMLNHILMAEKYSRGRETKKVRVTCVCRWSNRSTAIYLKHTSHSKRIMNNYYIQLDSTLTTLKFFMRFACDVCGRRPCKIIIIHSCRMRLLLLLRPLLPLQMYSMVITTVLYRNISRRTTYSETTKERKIVIMTVWLLGVRDCRKYVPYLELSKQWWNVL